VTQINPVHVPIPLPEDPSQYYLSIYVCDFQAVSFPQVSPPIPCLHISSSSYVLHAELISFFSI
jgi:hypothetical protein